MRWIGVFRGWQPADGLLWVHRDRADEQAKGFLQNESGLDAPVAENLLAEETRSRALEIEGNLLVNLRGVNLILDRYCAASARSDVIAAWGKWGRI